MRPVAAEPSQGSSNRAAGRSQSPGLQSGKARGRDHAHLTPVEVRYREAQALHHPADLWLCPASAVARPLEVHVAPTSDGLRAAELGRAGHTQGEPAPPGQASAESAPQACSVQLVPTAPRGARQSDDNVRALLRHKTPRLGHAACQVEAVLERDALVDEAASLSGQPQL